MPITITGTGVGISSLGDSFYDQYKTLVGPQPYPTSTPDLVTAGAITGTNPQNFGAATYGKVIPIVIGGAPRIGGYIIYGPKFRTDGAGIKYCSFGVSFGLQANPDGERELWEIRLDGVKVWTPEDDPALVSGAGVLRLGGTFRFTQGSETQEPDVLLVTDYGAAAPAFRSQCCLFFTDVPLTTFDGGHVPFVSAVLADVTDGADPTDGILLGEALERLASSAYIGMSSDEFETTGITTRIDALIDAERSSFMDLLLRLARLLPLDVVQTDKLRVMERSDITPDIVLTPNRIVAGENAITIQRGQESDVAQELELITIDIGRDYEMTPQKARRPIDPIALTSSRGKETINLPIVTTASDAISWVTLRKYWDEVAREGIAFTALPYGMAIEPGAMVAIKTDLKTYVVRVRETLHEARGTVRCVGMPVLRCSLSGIDDGPEIGDEAGGMFVVAGQDVDDVTELWTSDDASTWEEQSFVPSADNTDILGAADRSSALFVMVGTTVDGNALASTSPDGTAWTQSASAEAISGRLIGVCCGNPSVCVAVGYDFVAPSTIILTSADGLAWVQQTPASTDVFLTGVAYGGGVHVACGADAATSTTPKVMSSTDGASWTNRTPNPSSSCYFNSVSHDGTSFIAVGAPNGMSSGPIISTSTNGVSWTDHSLVSPDPGNLSCVASNSSGRTVAVGNQGSDPLIMTSDGGASWTERTCPTLSGGGYLNAVTFNGDETWVAVGSNGDGGNVIISSSDNGETWALESTPTADGNLTAVIGR